MAEDQVSDAPMAEIASKIQETRVSLGWTQNELAERAGVSRPSVARIERGDDVSTATLEKVAAALELKLELSATKEVAPPSVDVGGSWHDISCRERPRHQASTRGGHYG